MSEGRELGSAGPVGEDDALPPDDDARRVDVGPEDVFQPRPAVKTPIATAPEHSFYAPILAVLVTSAALMGLFILAVAGVWVWSLLRVR